MAMHDRELLRSYLCAAVIVVLCACKDTGANAIACDGGFSADSGQCIPVACGTGRWGDLVLDGSTVFVDVQAAEAGDGSEAAPFSSIQEGLDAAYGGAMVAVAAGTYAETLALTAQHAGVQLAGRCRDLVVIDASVGDEDTPGIAISAGSGAVEVSGVTVRGARSGGIVADSGTATIRASAVVDGKYGVVASKESVGPTSLLLESCEVAGNTVVGVLAQGSSTTVALSDSTVHDNVADETGKGGYGLQVSEGATVTAVSCQVVGNTGIGVLVGGANAEAILTATTVQDTQPGGYGVGGYGIEVYGGGTLVAEDCEVVGNTGAGVFLDNPGTSVMLNGTSILDTRPDENGIGGVGLDIWHGAALSAADCEVVGNTSAGVRALDASTSVALLGTIIRGTQPDGTGEYGSGVQVAGGATLSAESCEVLGNTRAGFDVRDVGTTVALRGTTVRGTVSDATLQGGAGIYAVSGATLIVDASQVTENTGAGVHAAGAGTSVALRDTLVMDTRPNASLESGFGILVYDGAALVVDSSFVDGNRQAGILADDAGTSVFLRESVVSGTRRGTLTEQGTVGLGISAQGGANILASGVEVTKNEGPGLYSVDEGSFLSCLGCSVRDNEFAGGVVLSVATLEITESFIANTDSNIDLGGGVGVFADSLYYGGLPSLILTGNTIQDNAAGGVQLFGAGSYRLFDNIIVGGEGVPYGSGTKCGDAVFAGSGIPAWNGTGGLQLAGNQLSGGGVAGLFLDSASAALSDNLYADNGVADIVRQGETCDMFQASFAEAGSVSLCPEYDYATCYEVFALSLVLADIESGKGRGVPAPMVRRLCAGGCQ